jgi:integrase
MARRAKKKTAPRDKPGWAHNRFQPTGVPCLYRRNGVYGVMHYGRVKRHGRIYLSKLCAPYEAAKKRLRRWLSEVEAKAAATVSAEANAGELVTWGQFADRYLRSIDLDVALADKSKQYRHECVHRITATWQGIFNDDLRERKMNTITQEQCSLWASGIAGYHTTTYNNTVATLKHIFAEAIAAGHLLTSPAGRLKRIGKLPRVDGCVLGEPGEPLTPQEREALEFADVDEARWYPTREQFQAILKQMRTYKFGPVKAATQFAQLLAFTGCRLSEANRLRWGDVDWTKNRLRVNGAKGRATSSASSIRYVPLNNALTRLLRSLERAAPERRPTEKIAKVRECRGTLQRACDDLGLPRKLDHHDLRHWFATRAVADGIPVPVVADWLGHRDGGALLLKVYRHEDEAVSQQWVARLKL